MWFWKKIIFWDVQRKLLNEEKKSNQKKYGNFVDSSIPEITEEVIN